MVKLDEFRANVAKTLATASTTGDNGAQPPAVKPSGLDEWQEEHGSFVVKFMREHTPAREDAEQRRPPVGDGRDN